MPDEPKKSSASSPDARGSAVRRLHILNLGAGVQSTTLYLLSMEGRIQRFDAAIFADTQDEPGAEERRLGLPDPPESVYAHLDWLIALNGPPILVRTRGRISTDLLREKNSTGQRFASIPAYTSADHPVGSEKPEEGMIRRQCTKEYKIEVIERAIRYELIGLSPRQHLPKDVIVHQYIGISWDERARAFDIRRRFVDDNGQPKPNWRGHFPLLTINGEVARGWTREECVDYLRVKVPHKVYGSACVMCPFQDDPTWARRMEPGPTRERLIEIDTGIRTPGLIVNRGLDQKLYLHRDCKPITEIDFVREKQMGFAMECEGGCGL